MAQTVTSPATFITRTRRMQWLLHKAQRHDVILVSPDTRDPQGFLSDLQHDTLQQMIAEISQTREVDPDQIYLFGDSQGDRSR